MLRKRLKKGLSTIVSTLLILLLVFVAIGILWVVVRNVIQSGSEQVSLGKFTLDLKIDKVTINSDNTIDVKVTRNPGAGEFTGLRFILDDGDNTEVVEVKNLTLNEYAQRTFKIPVPTGMLANNIQKIELAPIFTLSSGKESNGDVKATWNKPSSVVNNGGTVTSNCNNGIIDSGEQCDGSLLNNASCSSVLGVSTATGTLSCSNTCTFITTGCSLPTCGNSQIDSGEQCDGTNLNGGTCASALGVAATGTLACQANSCQYDTSGCSATIICGNNLIEGTELCDGTDLLPGASCENLFGSQYTGTVSCASNCSSYVTTCTASQTCGNNLIEGTELCDGTDLLPGASCENLFGSQYTGTVSCAANCSSYVTSCTASVSYDWEQNVVARWNFESGALGTDSVGSNTLTVSGVTADTTNYAQGVSSAYFNKEDYTDKGYISDSALSSGFPLKNGGSNKAMTVTFWVRYEATDGFGYLYAKSLYDNQDKSFVLFNNFGALRLDIGYGTAEQFEIILYGSTLTTNRWYFIAATYDDSTRAYRMRVWDNSTQALVAADKTGTTTNNILLNGGPVYIGQSVSGYHQFDGRIDKMMVFNKALSTTEIDQVRTSA